MGKSKAQKLNDLHQEALAQFDLIQKNSRDERKQNLEDRRFYSIAGAQWEGKLGEQYENKPKFEVNKVHLSVIRIINEYRNNRITVDFTPRKATDDKLADLCDGLYRADENDSEAREAYDNAFEEAVGGGMGAWRLRAEYEDEYDDENDNQRIRIEPIYDADTSVYFDLDAKRQDKADAKHCFLVTSMTKEAYIEKWDDDPTTWPKDDHSYEFDWDDNDSVFVAEYFVVEEKLEPLIYVETITGDEEKHYLADVTDEMWEEWEATGTVETSRRKIKRRKVHKYIMSGGGILEDCGHIAGREIPIIPAYGKRWMVDGIERSMGHVRLAKDAQRLKNMQLSKLGEISALSSVEKPILTPEQIAGHANMWANDNIKDYPYLLINPITNEEGQVVAQGPISYTKPSNIPPAMGALLQITEEDMRDILGNQQQGEDMASQVSGKAVEMIQTRLDMQTYIYMSNFSKAMKRCGEVWLSMAKDLYIEDEREMKVVDKEGEAKTEKIVVTAINDEGDVAIENNLEEAHFDVNVEVGPSSNSKRAAIVRALTGMLGVTTDPETKLVLEAMSMMNMEGEGMGDIREFFRQKLVRIGAMEPTEEDIQQMQLEQGGPTPNDQYLLAEAQRAEAEAAKNRADTAESVANAELKMAQAEKTRAEVAAPVMAAPEVKDYKGQELLLKAQKEAKELQLKEREIELKEQEQKLRAQEQTAKLAEIGMKLMDSEAEAINTAQGHQAALDMAQQVAEAVKGLQPAIEKQNEALDKQAADRAEAMKKLDEPKMVKRDEDGNITGIE